MAQVYPFRAFRYNPKQAPFDRVLTQPYDKISTDMQDKYYAADRHNLIVVEKGRAYPSDTPQNSVYTRATAAIEDWIRTNIVVQDPTPSFYAYTQDYTVPARANPLRSEGRPAGTFAPHENAHRPTFHVVFGRGETY
jgi:uncharacterized protein (DUF1015 family)